VKNLRSSAMADSVGHLDFERFGDLQNDLAAPRQDKRRWKHYIGYLAEY
jgi:hypothetical protein